MEDTERKEVTDIPVLEPLTVERREMKKAITIRCVKCFMRESAP